MLDVGMNIFYSKGYNGTGIQDIATANGMSKGSIYVYFKGKEDFAIQALDHYTKTLSHYLKGALLSGEGKALHRLKELWYDWAENMFIKNNGCGCFAGNMSQEMANHSPQIRKSIQRSFNTLESVYKDCLTLAQQEGDLPETIDIQKTATFIYNGWQGAMIRAKAEQDNIQVKQYLDYIFETILKEA